MLPLGKWEEPKDNIPLYFLNSQKITYGILRLIYVNKLVFKFILSNLLKKSASTYRNIFKTLLHVLILMTNISFTLGSLDNEKPIFSHNSPMQFFEIQIILLFKTISCIALSYTSNLLYPHKLVLQSEKETEILL